VQVTVWVRRAEIELREMREGELSRLELSVWLDLWRDIVRHTDVLRVEPEHSASSSLVPNELAVGGEQVGGRGDECG